MSDHVSADVPQMRWLAGRIDEAAGALYDGQTRGYASGEVPDHVFEGWPVPEAAFGNTAGGPACHAEWISVKEAIGAASVHLWQVLRSDVLRVDQAVQTFESTDAEEADRIVASGRMTFISAHTHSGGDLEDDVIRGQQNYRLAELADGVGTPAIVGADLNENLGANFESLDGEAADGLPEGRQGQDNYSARSIASFDEHNYLDVGPAGPTSGEGEGQRIDHMRARGVAVDGARVVDGGPSDHHGQAAEVTVPWW